MEWTEYAKIITDKCKQLGTPSYASFELTPLCNFNCNMCYIHLSPEQAKKQGTLLSTEQWLHIAQETKNLGTLGLEVTGGEAVTRPDFPLLYKSFIKMGYLVTLRSNGYLLNGKLLELLKNYKPRCVCITMYGASNDTYRKVCGIDDGFTVVSDNIHALKNAGINLKLSVTLTKDNENDREMLLEWAKKNNEFLSFYGGLITPIRSAKRSIKHLKASYKYDELSSDIIIPFRDVPDRQKYMNPFWMCREYGARFCISWDGRMTLCNCLPSIWTEPLSLGVQGAYNLLYEKLNMISRPIECTDCKVIDYCYTCPSHLLSETGNHEKTCRNICRIAEINYSLSKGNLTKYPGHDEKDLFKLHKERTEINEN